MLAQKLRDPNSSLEDILADDGDTDYEDFEDDVLEEEQIISTASNDTTNTSLSSTTFTRLTKADVFDHLKRRGLTPLSPAQRREEYFRYVEDMFIAQKDLHSYISYYRNRQVEFWPRWKVLVWRESLKSRTHLLALLELQENEADLLAEGVKKYGLLKKRCLLSTCTGSSGRPHRL